MSKKKSTPKICGTISNILKHSQLGFGEETYNAVKELFKKTASKNKHILKLMTDTKSRGSDFNFNSNHQAG